MEISVVMSVSVTRHASLFARKILMLVTRSRSHKYAAYLRPLKACSSTVTPDASAHVQLLVTAEIHLLYSVHLDGK